MVLPPNRFLVKTSPRERVLQPVFQDHWGRKGRVFKAEGTVYAVAQV